MTKTRTRWAAGESPASSSKQNEQTVDYISPGKLICSSVGGIDNGAAETPSIHPVALVFYLGWYPWNPAKSVYDRLRIWSHKLVVGGSGTQELQYTVSSGSVWTSTATGSVATPVPINNPFQAANGGTADLDVDLSSFTGFRWIGFRWSSDGGAAITYLGWFLQAFLYRSDAFDTFADVDPF